MEFREQIAKLIWAMRFREDEWMPPDNKLYLEKANQILFLFNQWLEEQNALKPSGKIIKVDYCGQKIGESYPVYEPLRLEV